MTTRPDKDIKISERAEKKYASEGKRLLQESIERNIKQTKELKEIQDSHIQASKKFEKYYRDWEKYGDAGMADKIRGERRYRHRVTPSSIRTGVIPEWEGPSKEHSLQTYPLSPILSTPTIPKSKYIDFNNYRNIQEENVIVRDIVNDIKKDLKGSSNIDKYNTIHHFYLKNKYSPFPHHINRKIDNKLIKYMIDNGIAGDKQLSDELLESEYPMREAMLRTRGIYKPLDSNVPQNLLIENKKYRDLRLLMTDLRKEFWDRGGFSSKKKWLKKINELNEEGKIKANKGRVIKIINLLNRGNIKDVMNEELENIYNDSPYMKRVYIKTNTRQGTLGYAERASQILNNIILQQGNWISSMTNTAVPVEQLPNNIINLGSLMKNVNKNNKIKFDKYKPVFISGGRKDIKINFKIGKSIQVAQMKNGLIEIHILIEYLNEGDLKVLSHYLYKTNGTLYNRNKNKIGIFNDKYDADRLIRTNLNYKKPINVFFVEPKTLKGGSLSRFHSGIGTHNYLRMKLL